MSYKVYCNVVFIFNYTLNSLVINILLLTFLLIYAFLLSN